MSLTDVSDKLKVNAKEVKDVGAVVAVTQGVQRWDVQVEEKCASLVERSVDPETLSEVKVLVKWHCSVDVCW